MSRWVGRWVDGWLASVLICGWVGVWVCGWEGECMCQSVNGMVVGGCFHWWVIWAGGWWLGG